MEEGKCLWKPSKAWIDEANLTHYQKWLGGEYGLSLHSYDELWKWSIDDIAQFWQSIWHYFTIESSGKPSFVMSDDPMPDTTWFAGTQLNYARHLFRHKNDLSPAIVAYSEARQTSEISWQQLESQVASVAAWMKKNGIGQGDCVAACLPNIPEATVAFMAACSIGAIWSSCSPDFGVSSVIDRFSQIAPKLMIVVDGYRYNGKEFDKREASRDIVGQLDTLEHVLEVPLLNPGATTLYTNWLDVISDDSAELVFTPVPFDHPIWILYSSGTTGIPKAITHSHGGVLLEHLKYLTFHNDVKPGERFFWYTTTGWMMWNYVHAALLAGATIVLYDGSPGYPDMNVLWKMAAETGLQHFGTSAPFLQACQKEGIVPREAVGLSHLRSLSSTGSPLPAETFDWVYGAVKKDLWLVSMSGGTDVCTAFIGGVPTEPVFAGEIQKRALGCALYALDESGQAVNNTVGEMVITKPMPSMPIYFWNDPDKQRYRASYFEMYPGAIWRHGDWIKLTVRQSILVYGRSDATLNRHGIRIGTAEIYRSLDKIEAVLDGLIVNLDLEGGKHFMPLFVILREGEKMSDDLRSTINRQIRADYTPRHVPDDIIEVSDIPYTISGKKLEAPVKKILMGIELTKAANLGAMRNPDSLKFFMDFAKSMRRST